MSTVDVALLRQSLKGHLIDFLITEDEVLGRGFYGDVFAVKYDGLRCAGKRLHASVFAKTEVAEPAPPSSEGAAATDEENPKAEGEEAVHGTNGAEKTTEVESLEERFGKEWAKISQLRHPNVVQLLGVHVPVKESDGALPTVVMELLPFNLPAVLEKYAIPVYTKRSLLVDVGTGLQYLHGRSPPIVHGHLSASSVLLSASLQAKISPCFLGFGAPSRVKNLIYSPPEARRGDTPTTSVDVFGFGNLIIHVFLQKEIMLIEDASLTEVQRRERFLSDMEASAQLTELAKKCLHNDPLYRPSMSEVVYQLEEIIKANPPEYASYLDMLGALDKLSHAKKTIDGLNAVIQAKNDELTAERLQQESLKQEIEAKEQQIEAKKEEIEVMKHAVQSKHKLVQAHETAVRAKDALIKAKAMEIAAKAGELAAKDSLLRVASKRIEALEQQSVTRRGSQQVSHVRTPSFERGDLLSPGFRAESPQVAPKPPRPKPPSPATGFAEAEDVQGHGQPPVVMRKMKGRRSHTMIVSDGYRYQNWGMQKSKSVEVTEEVDPKLAAWIAKRQQIEETQEAADANAKQNELGSIREDSGSVAPTVNGNGATTP